MIEKAARLVDFVFSEVPIRQWAPSCTWPMSLLFASSPGALSRHPAVIVRAIQATLSRRAGLAANRSRRTGVVILIQRFGSAQNENVRLHMLLLGGIYVRESDGLQFHLVDSPDTKTIERALNRLDQPSVKAGLFDLRVQWDLNHIRRADTLIVPGIDEQSGAAPGMIGGPSERRSEHGKVARRAAMSTRTLNRRFR